MENNPHRWLICGTRKKGYEKLVWDILTDALVGERQHRGDPNWAPLIIEGCCPDSADEYAEAWAKKFGLENKHYPSTSGNYLKRNIEMVNDCTGVIAFWDSFSYGTAHTIAFATSTGKDIRVIMLR